MSDPSRRDFLRGAARGLVVVATAACSRKPSAPFACTDVTGLAPEDASARATLGYVEPSTNAARSCSQCQQYLGPPSGEGCGACKVLKGPIHPTATCKAFAPSLM